MNALDLDRINSMSPYVVTLWVDNPYVYWFYTDFGVEYEIVIKANDIFIASGAYALDIINVWHQPSPGDPKFRQTLMAIVEEFFRQNNDVMLYVTETKDSKQASRNRLFVRWFNTYEHRDLYVIFLFDWLSPHKNNIRRRDSRKSLGGLCLRDGYRI
ncbi:MAG: DUF6169 family protein [Prevotella sp.]